MAALPEVWFLVRDEDGNEMAGATSTSDFAANVDSLRKAVKKEVAPLLAYAAPTQLKVYPVGTTEFRRSTPLAGNVEVPIGSTYDNPLIVIAPVQQQPPPVQQQGKVFVLS